MGNIMKKDIDKAYRLYKEGKYKEVILHVHSIYGWKEGELGKQEYTKEKAKWCLKQLWVN